MTNNQSNELRAKVSRMIIECRSQDGQIDEWGERELRDDILQLITSEKEAAYKKGYIDGGINELEKHINAKLQSQLTNKKN